jgi:mono/diheme cytochrome c family protein
MRRLALLLVLPLGLGVAGCIDGSKTTATPNTVVGTIAKPQAPTVPAGDATAGKNVFTKIAGCISCHTLADAGATGTVGPNLDNAKPDKARIFDRVTHGKNQMPSFKGTLTDKQIADVVAYVYAATHK